MRELGGKEGAGFSWSSVAKRLGGGRTGKSCRLRYTFEPPARIGHGCRCRNLAVTNVPLLRHRHNPNPGHGACWRSEPSLAQCRWYNQLSPNLKREPFDHQEDLLIIQVRLHALPMEVLRHNP